MGTLLAVGKSYSHLLYPKYQALNIQCAAYACEKFTPIGNDKSIAPTVIIKKMANTFGSNMNRMASTNFSSENSSTGIGAGPTPLACTLSPQNGWSPKNGTIVVGH